MTDWKIAEVWEAIAAAAPDRPALVCGARTTRWAEFDGRADALGRRLIACGLGRQAKVAAYLYNGSEFLDTYYAAFKAGLVPFNVNYRYGPEELFYLLDNADAEAVVFHASFSEKLEGLRARLPAVKAWICVAEPDAPTPDWALDYEELASGDGPRCQPPWGRSGDDLLLMYTGGTTGMPKGVMWRQDDLFQVLGAGGNPTVAIPPLRVPAEAGDRARRAGPPLVSLVACPLMHATGQFSAIAALNLGNCVATSPNRKFDAEALWEVERLGAARVIIVGPAFAIPMLDALDTYPGRWDLSQVRAISSSGAMWSYENKQGLLRHMPQALLQDNLGSSESVGIGGSSSAAGAEAKTAAFVLGPSCAVFTEDGRRVEPGSGERGLVAVSGFIPLGYYKDEEKTAATFRMFEDKRWSVPGDWAEVDLDGGLKLYGRGSQCINTGGEKVFPEEVEEALKTHAAVRDAVVVGVPDPRFGERICAVVDFGSSAPLGLSEVAAHVKAQLADYKAPRELVAAPVLRAPNGKVDYKHFKALALEALSAAV